MLSAEGRRAVRVLFGDRFLLESLSRELAPSSLYADYFDINGHFKRRSVIVPQDATAAKIAERGGCSL
jgi:hypothetical protein